MRGEVVNDESAMTFEPCRLANLVKIEITNESTTSIYETTLLARAFVYGMASPAIACIGVIGKYVRVLYALRAMQ
jgi:hypothetical protein